MGTRRGRGGGDIVDPMSLASELSTLGLVPVLLWIHVKSESRQDRQEARIEEQRKESEQRFEAMAKGWQKQLEAMIEKQDAKESELRDRFDKTVEKLDSQRATIQSGIQEDVKALAIKVEDVVRFIARPVR